MEIFFLLLLSSYKLNNLTFENMFNYELENVLKEKEKEFKKIESEAKCNVVVFFSVDIHKMVFKSITDIRNELFNKLNIEYTGKSVISIEHENPKVDSEKKQKFNFKRLLKKTEIKLENPDMEISKISPDNYFGMKTEGIIDTKNKKLARTSRKDLFIADFYPEDIEEHSFCKENI
ncbi:hypothetical protein GVAV_001217 [Gurleya vavrai]